MDSARFIVLTCAGLSMGLLALNIQRSLMRGLQQYRRRYTHDAAHSLRDLYMFVDVQMLWPVVFWMAVTAFLFMCYCGMHWGLALSLAGVLMAVPSVLIRYAKFKRLQLFEQQLPDALQSLSATLSAGASFMGGLQMLVQYSPSPLAQEFSVVAREIRLGVSLENAIQHLMSRMPCRGLQTLGATVLVAIQTGGPMAEMLMETASSLIYEMQIQQKADALMSQGWLQAWVMGGMPVGLILVLAQMDEQFWPQLMGTLPGFLLLGCIVVLEGVGLLWLHRIAKQVAHGE